MVKIVCISDTHMWGMPLAEIPRGDILIHSGDATHRGTIPQINNFYQELIKHKKDTRYGPGFKEIIFVPGNHDFGFEQQEALCREIMADVHVLINQDYHYYHEDGTVIKFWGSPVCPPFGRWAFYKGGEDRKELWNKIPEDTDYVITHGPPAYILDEIVNVGWNGEGIEHTGCGHLHNRMIEINPIVHQFGHIHETYGWTKLNGATDTTFVNASIMSEYYRPVNKPIVLEVYNDSDRRCARVLKDPESTDS